MKIIFFGNTRFSLIGAKIIHSKFGLSQIVTLPDRPDKKGRPTPNPLKSFAIENNIPYLLVDKITHETIETISDLNPDFLIVEDYGLLLPDALLKLPKYESLNIHHSLLPKYRGTSPAPFAILSGDKITGVTVIAMNDKVDAGDILAQKEYEIKPTDTTESLLTELNKLGGGIILPVLKDYIDGVAHPIKQDESKASYTERMSKSDGQIDINNPPDKDKLDRMIRAYYPWPGVWTTLSVKGKALRVKFLPKPLSLRGIEEDEAIPSNYLIQPEGGKPMSVKDFLNGYPEMRELLRDLFFLVG
ncbi:MAG TPA: methionyl-tRNA formyltransferase [Candidatus Saccharimonadales bacterium]|nr:methionyl-tRNA formyltransferase [Candidatus Saccharimonadales bacterium]